VKEDKLKKEYDFVMRNKEDLLKKYRNKYILVHNEKVVGSFKRFDRAASVGARKFGTNNDFLVHFLSDLESVNFVFNAAL